MDWFTADWHIDHTGICEKTGRPFSDEREMLLALITRYNILVRNEDTCYFIGDVFLGTDVSRLKHVMGQLNGRKILILGNHDILPVFSYIEAGFESVHTSLVLYHNDTKLKFILNHDPCVSCLDRNIDTYWLCGHVHDLFQRVNNVFNVGVDANQYDPVSIEMCKKEKF